MNQRPAVEAPRGRNRWGGWPLYLMMALGVVLGWEVVKGPLASRAPPEFALRAAPNSAGALQRAAEAELAAGRLDNARELADESLRRSPFNARALRIRGLADAQEGRLSQADAILTLAGNWSLRDDPAHAWLIERRLRQGSYASAFAHADTLARRRPELHPRLFSLFTTAISADTRAVPPLASLLAADPPWREAYIIDLLKREDGAPFLLVIGSALQQTGGPLKHDELVRIYLTWNSEARLAAIRYLQRQTGRPSADVLLQDGDFSRLETERLPPLDWQLESAPGVFADISEPDGEAEDDLALNVDYDGFGTVSPASQLLFLPPGRYQVSGKQMRHVGRGDSLLWDLSCVETGDVIARQTPGQTELQWEAFSLNGSVPSVKCTAQRLTLRVRPEDRRTTTLMSYDKMRVDRR